MHLFSFSLSLALSQNCEKRQLASSYLSVRLSVCMYVCLPAFLFVCLLACKSVCPSACNYSAPTGKSFMKFHIWLFFLKFWREIQVSLESDKNRRCFTRSFCIYDNIALNSSENAKCFGQNLYRQLQHIFMFNNFFFPKIVPWMR